MSKLGFWFWGSGRCRREPYWLALAVLVLAAWLTHAIGATIATGQPALAGYAAVGLLLGQTANAWASVCVTTRRLHDVGRSGWWQLVPMVIVVAAATLAEPAFATSLGIGETASMAALVVAIATYLGFLGVLGGVPSAGPNRFDPPLAADVF